MSKVTQQAKILAFCKEHGSITIRDGITKLGINAPWKRISEMRQSGNYIVDTVPEERVDDNGDKKRWVRYFIKEVDDGK